MSRPDAQWQPIESEPATTERLSVAVYWPNEGYGQARRCEGDGEAASYAARLQRLGYGTGRSEIHLIRERRDVRRFCPAPPSDAQRERE